MIFLYSTFLFPDFLFSFSCFSVSLRLIYLLLSDFSSDHLIILYTILRQTSADIALHYITLQAGKHCTEGLLLGNRSRVFALFCS